MKTEIEGPGSGSLTAEIQRKPAEVLYASQLEALRQNDTGSRPHSWKLSPRSVLTYITGGQIPRSKTGGTGQEVAITRKFFGDDSLVERAIVTLASERALLLIGEPGCGKSWLSEHLAAAISGSSILTLQGTAGTTEDHIKYSWNIARVIAEGPRKENLIPSPAMVAMQHGSLLRFEEITRCLPDVQDTLVSILSDRAIAIPELPNDNMIWARKGFNIIATANTRDQGVNEFSAALKRRFNYIHIPPVASTEAELEIVARRFEELIAGLEITVDMPASVLELVTAVFRELRGGRTSEGASIDRPSTTISTAEAINCALDSALQARFFGDGHVTARHVAHNLAGTVVKENPANIQVLKGYATLVAKRRGLLDPDWALFHSSLLEALS